MFCAGGSKIVGSLLSVACGIGHRGLVGVGRVAVGGVSSCVLNTGAVGGVPSGRATTATIGYATTRRSCSSSSIGMSSTLEDRALSAALEALAV